MNKKIEIKETNNKGKGLFATKLIKKDEVIFDLENGKIYEADKASDLPKEIQNYAIQISSNKYIYDTNDIGRFANHSCSPNAGFYGLFKIVAMRDIEPEEEIVYDYDMTENSDWVMEECRCGTKNCRNIIRGYRFLPDTFKRRYQNYISDWLKT